MGKNTVKSNEKIRNKEKCLISHQTRQDIISAILGFEALQKFIRTLVHLSNSIVALRKASSLPRFFYIRHVKTLFLLYLDLRSYVPIN
jgi:hypothetical protein